MQYYYRTVLCPPFYSKTYCEGALDNRHMPCYTVPFSIRGWISENEAYSLLEMTHIVSAIHDKADNRVARQQGNTGVRGLDSASVIMGGSGERLVVWTRDVTRYTDISATTSAAGCLHGTQAWLQLAADTRRRLRKTWISRNWDESGMPPRSELLTLCCLSRPLTHG